MKQDPHIIGDDLMLRGITTLSIPIGACYCSELCNAITSYSRVWILLTKVQ